MESSFLANFWENLGPLSAGAAIGWGVGFTVAALAALLGKFLPPTNLFLVLIALTSGTFFLVVGLAAAGAYLFGAVSAWVLVPLAIVCCLGVWFTAKIINLPTGDDHGF